MNRKRIALYCCAALVASGIGLNIQNAIADYGIGQNSLSLVAGPGSNSGSNSNSNSNSNWNSNSNSDSDNLVPNGKVEVVTNTHTGWKWNPTGRTSTVPVYDKDGNYIGTATVSEYEAVSVQWYDCDLVDYDKVYWRPLCKSPNSKEEAGAEDGQAPTTAMWW
jgi:hypothetical protein